MKRRRFKIAPFDPFCAGGANDDCSRSTNCNISSSASLGAKTPETGLSPFLSGTGEAAYSGGKSQNLRQRRQQQKEVKSVPHGQIHAETTKRQASIKNLKCVAAAVLVPSSRNLATLLLAAVGSRQPEATSCCSCTGSGYLSRCLKTEKGQSW